MAPLNFTSLFSMNVGIWSMRMVCIPCVNFVYRLIFCRQTESVLSAENPTQEYVKKKLEKYFIRNL